MAVRRFEDLPRILTARKAEVLGLVDQIMRHAATTASHALTAETPVKTGAARSNWVATHDAAFEGILPPYHPYNDLPSHVAAPPDRKFETANLESARAQNAAAIVEFSTKRNRAIIFRNNAEHIGLLNAGRSVQSEAGWFERAFEEVVHSVIGRWRLRS